MYRNAEGETSEDIAARFGLPLPDEPEVPIQADFVWEWFWDLHKRRRSSNNSVPHPILHTDLLAFQQVIGIEFDPDESWMLLHMDDVLVGTWSELVQQERKLNEQNASGKRTKASPRERGKV